MLRWDLWRNVLPAVTERSYTQKPGQEFQECSRCPKMVVVPAGEFMMGSPETEKGRDSDEGRHHKVTIAKPIAVGKFEVTFDDWNTCVELEGCKTNLQPSDSGWDRGNRPVINVSWHDAKQYVSWLSKLTGKPYRLLTEAEWEYSARAQTTITGESSLFSFGDDVSKLGEYAWYAANSDRKTQEVGKKLPNAFWLHDMHGNVWEWVEDCYAEDYNGAPANGSARAGGDCEVRVLRGGSFYSDPVDLRSAERSGSNTDIRNFNIGFRVARTLQ